MKNEIINYITYDPAASLHNFIEDKLTGLCAYKAYSSLEEAQESAKKSGIQVAKVICSIETDYQE